MRTTLYLYSHTQQPAILSSSSFWHHTKIRRFTMVCRSPHLLFSVRCYKKAIEKNSCVFSGASMWKMAKKTEISKASMMLGQRPWTFPPHQQRMRMQNAILLIRIKPVTHQQVFLDKCHWQCSYAHVYEGQIFFDKFFLDKFHLLVWTS